MGKAQQAKRVAQAEHQLVGAVANNRHSALVKWLGKASEIGDQPPLAALSLATIAAGALFSRADVARTGVRMLVGHAIGTGAKTALKTSIDRSRPARALKDNQHRSGTGKGASDSDFNSFPSGHTTGAVSIAQAVATTNPPLAVPARLAAAAIALIQLPRGKHYPSDLLVGALLGWAADQVAGTLVVAAERGLRHALDRREEQRSLAEAEAHPS